MWSYCDFLTLVTLILTNSHKCTWKYDRELVRFVSLKMNSKVYPLKSTNSHYLLLNATIIPLCKGKISLIFLWGMLQMRNDQRTVVISEAAIFIKFHWIHWHENEFIKKKQASHHITTRMASQLASMIYGNNQNKYVWRKDRQEDLVEIFNESID